MVGNPDFVEHRGGFGSLFVDFDGLPVHLAGHKNVAAFLLGKVARCRGLALDYVGGVARSNSAGSLTAYRLLHSRCSENQYDEKGELHSSRLHLL